METTKTILLVDDDPAILEVNKRALVALGGIKIVSAEDGEAALEVIKSTVVDLIISDISMPNRDGLSLLMEIRRRGIEIPVIFLTGKSEAQPILEALRLGAADFIGKCVDRGEFIDKIKTHLAKKNQTARLLELLEFTLNDSVEYERRCEKILEWGCQRLGFDVAGVIQFRDGAEIHLEQVIGPLPNMSDMVPCLTKIFRSVPIKSTLSSYEIAEYLPGVAGHVGYDEPGMPQGSLVAIPLAPVDDRWIFFGGRTLRDRVLDANQRQLAFCVAKLISSLEERIQSEADLNQVLSELADQKKALDLSASVTVADPKGKITYVNRLFCDSTKYDAAEIIGKDHRFLNSGFHPKEFFEKMWETILGGRIWRGEIRNRGKGGVLIWYDMTIVPFLNANGEILQFVSIRTDITARKESEETKRIQQTAILRSAKMAALGEMAAGVAHQINNPLAILASYVYQAKQCLKAPEINTNRMDEIFGKLDTTISRISKIIRGLSSFSRDASQDPLQSISLNALVTETVDFCIAKAMKFGAELRVADLSEAPLVQGRPSQIAEVLVNLLNNSIDAISDMGEKWIDISWSTHDNRFYLYVTDCGKGISPEIRERIFQPFFTTKPVGVGTGIGLSLARKMMEQNEGRLYYDPGHTNTRFILEMKLAEERDQNLREAS